MMSGGSAKKPNSKAIHPTLIFVSVLVLHVAAILVFTRGFLLARTELPFHSDCSDVSSSPCFSSGVERGSPSFLNGTSRDGGFRGCWTKPVVEKIVIVVLDALRFDFVAPSSFFEEKKPWMDKLQVLQKLTFKERSPAMIFKAIADPPTTSLQRLKGLTIGGLPTFVDIGNSFGTPALAEDNLINQLIENGKRVVMMGDDTWVQLFPHHFVRSYPLPSFNVKDLDTVDNGCIEHLFPSLYEEDWDVLIAHFLGMDHAGHIFGVDSAEMIQKLEQYNHVLEKVIEVLESQSGPGGLHENTLLLVMGDHGQTLNGDHGGGSAEEVETSMFAMSLKRSLPFIPPEIETPHEFDSEKRVHISSFQQLDFAVTVSALLGIPFPFGSIGRVNHELYALAAGNWSMEKSKVDYGQNYLNSERWLHDYVRVLCTNAWQMLIIVAFMVAEEFMSLVGLVREVKRYIDIYSASSLIGFSSDDVSLLSNAYVRAEKMFLKAMNALASQSDPGNTLVTHLKSSIDAYSEFLARVSELAHSKWTEFKLGMMGFGLGIMLFTLLFQYFAIRQVIGLLGTTSHQVSGDSGPYFGSLFACFLVGIHAMSVLSNSYLVEEAKVATFLLATAVFIKFRHSIKKMKMVYEAGAFLFLILILRFAIYVGLSKQAGMTTSLSSSSWIIRINEVYSAIAAEVIPIVALIFLAYILYRTIASGILLSFPIAIVVGAICCYVLIAVHWTSESTMSNLGFKTTGKTLIPRIVYAIVFGELLLLAFGKLGEARVADCRESLFNRTVCMLCTWSSTVILLSGKQGPLIALASIIGGYCIVKLQNAGDDSGVSVIIDPLSVVEWSLLAVIMFFCTGHWCAFDGLRYGAAFVGFDEFALVRQAILLTIETFGFSHIIPVFGVPFLVIGNNLFSRTKQPRKLVAVCLTQVYLMYGLIIAATVTVTIICVTIQRRHLMVWALFAPKFVFDVVGLILADILICLASVYYHLPDRIERPEGPTSKIMNIRGHDLQNQSCDL